MRDLRIAILLGTAAVCTLASAAPAMAQSMDERRAYNIPAQPVADALIAFSRQSGIQVVSASGEIGARQSQAVRGRFPAGEALDRMLGGTGLGWSQAGRGSIVVRTEGRAVAGDAAAEYQGAEIVVTGTSIRGIAPRSSPSLTYSRRDIDNSGYQTTEDFFRSIPQSFGGGATPLSTRSPSDIETGENTTAGAGANLRGLGAGATLVLINGRRLAPSGSTGSFVDISSISLSAVNRIDILTDGASAIYGADAVAGVVNFILRDDYDGAETGVEYGLVTEGGLQQVRLSQLFGRTWEGGNALINFEYFDRAQLLASEKDFAAAAPDPLTLIPSLERFSVMGSLAQELSPSLSFDILGLYAKNDTRNISNSGRPNNPFNIRTASSESFLIAPSLGYSIGSGWRARLSGSWSQSESSGENTLEGGLPRPFESEASLVSADALFDGPLVQLPGGRVRAAIGGAFRYEDFSARTNQLISANRTASALFGELYVPIVGPANSIPGIERVEINAAVRYDRYSDFGGSVNPKVGVLWEVSPGISLRGSYGTSYNPPNLGLLANLDLQAITSFLPDPSSPTGTTATLRLLGGVKSNLVPEEAQTYTIGADVRRPLGRGTFSASATYYNIRFENRIGQPPQVPGGGSQTIINRSFLPESLFLENPPLELVQGLLDRARASIGILDQTGGVLPNNPAAIQLIVDFNLQNLASVETDGIDLNLNYAVPVGSGALTMSLNGNYILHFKRQAADSTPVLDVVNTVFNPAGFRLRGGASYRNAAFSTSIFVNQVGGYLDNRSTTTRPVSSFTTVDATLSLDLGQIASQSFFSNLQARFSVTNLFDQSPPAVFNDSGAGGAFYTNASYDPTNANPLGRFVSFQITKRW